MAYLALFCIIRIYVDQWNSSLRWRIPDHMQLEHAHMWHAGARMSIHSRYFHFTLSDDDHNTIDDEQGLTCHYLSLLVPYQVIFFCSRWWTRPYHRRHGTSRHLVPEGTVSLRGIQVVPEATRAHFESKARPWNMWKIWWIWNVDDL